MNPSLLYVSPHTLVSAFSIGLIKIQVWSSVRRCIFSCRHILQLTDIHQFPLHTISWVVPGKGCAGVGEGRLAKALQYLLPPLCVPSSSNAHRSLGRERSRKLEIWQRSICSSSTSGGFRQRSLGYSTIKASALIASLVSSVAPDIVIFAGVLSVLTYV
jgi:hypothetical protein